MKLIPLTGTDKTARVDDEDYAEVMKHKWRLSRGYPVRSLPRAGAGRPGKKFNQYLHTFLMGSREGFEVDHKDGDSLNFQRDNLRWATRGQQQSNQKKRSGCRSQYKGINWHKKNRNWVARITVGYHCLSLGSFEKEVDAAWAYDWAAIKYFGEFARLNFPK